MAFGISASALFVGGAALAGSVYAADKASSANKRATNAALSAAEMERQTATDTLNYYRERDAQSAALQAQANGIAGRVANAQVALMNQQRQQSAEYFNRLKTVFWPVENELVKDAQEYDTPARREAEAAKASADVTSAFEATRQANNRGMMRLGVNPGSNRFQSTQSQLALGEAAAKAGSANAARNAIEQQGWSRRMDVTALGKGLPGVSATAASTAVGAGNSAVNAAYQPVSAFNASTQIMGNALSNYAQGISNSYDRVTNAYNNTASMWGQAASGFGNLAGSALGIYAAGAGGGGGSTGGFTPTSAMAPVDYGIGSSGARLSAW